jgi:hypothetical protein
VVFGRDNTIFLEAIKRGGLKAPNGPRSIVLRLYEAYGGYACVCFHINVRGVTALYVMNLLGDDAGAEVVALE